MAQIGPNAFALWSAIKAHADYQTGLAYPSIRRLMELTGLASATVQKCLHTLEDAKLLRSEVKGRSRYYIARERLDISLGSRVLCTVVVDYVPSKLRAQVQAVKEALESGKDDPEVFASVEIIPGAGFTWDASANVLRGTVKASEMPSGASQNHLGDLAPLIERARSKALPRPRVPKK